MKPFVAIFYSIALLIGSQPILAQEGAWVWYDRSQVFGYNVSAVTADQDNTIWAISSQATKDANYYGIDYFDGTTWTRASTEALGFPLADTTTLNEITTDRSGNIWVSAYGSILRYDGTSWQSFLVQDSLAEWREYDQITCDSNGTIWVTTKAFRFQEKVGNITIVLAYIEMFSFDGTTWTTIFHGDDDTEFYYPLGFSAITTAPDGTIWAAYKQDEQRNTGGLYTFDGNMWQDHNLESAISLNYGKRPTDLVPDHNGKIWVCYEITAPTAQQIFSGGLSVFTANQQTWKHFTKDDGLPLHNDVITVNGLAMDRTMAKWLATPRSIVHLQDNNLTKVDLAAKFDLAQTDNRYRLVNMVNTVTADREGNIWFATTDGLVNFQPKITSVSAEPSLTLQDHKLQMYPQPVATKLHLQLPTIPSSHPATLTIFTQQGRKIWQTTIQQQSTLTLDVSSFAPGIYITQWQSGKHAITQPLMIVR